MPADGWLAVYANPDDSVDVDRIVAFALVDEWIAEDYEPVPSGVERMVRPIVNMGDGYLDVDDADNCLGVTHQGEWPAEKAGYEKMARQHNERRRKKAGLNAPATRAKVCAVCQTQALHPDDECCRECTSVSFVASEAVIQ